MNDKQAKESMHTDLRRFDELRSPAGTILMAERDARGAAKFDPIATEFCNHHVDDDGVLTIRLKDPRGRTFTLRMGYARYFSVMLAANMDQFLSGDVDEDEFRVFTRVANKLRHSFANAHTQYMNRKRASMPPVTE